MSTETLSSRPTTRPSRRLARRVIGAADALAAPHGIDRYVELVAPTWSSTEVRGRVVEVDRSTSDTVILTIEANGNWTGFEPGQYTQLSVEIDGVRHTRCYSMANAAPATSTRGRNARRIQLGVKAHPEGLVSQHLAAHAEVGMIVGLTPAAGEFHLPATRPDRVLLISGGSGMTPVMSMLRTLCDEGHPGPITFLHYARDAASVIFAEELRRIAAAHDNVDVVFAFDSGDGDLTGLMSIDHLDAVDGDWRDAETYVCGPGPLMEAVRDLYAAADADERFHQEAFTLTEFASEIGDVAGTVTFASSGTDVDSDGRPILDQAEAAGLTPTSGCRMGICHTCTRPLRSGTVRNAVTGECTTVNGTDVEIRVCVSTPVGDVTVDL